MRNLPRLNIRNFAEKKPEIKHKKLYGFYFLIHKIFSKNNSITCFFAIEQHIYCLKKEPILQFFILGSENFLHNWYTLEKNQSWVVFIWNL